MTFLEVKVDGGINEIEVGYDAIRNPGEKHQVARSVRVKPSLVGIRTSDTNWL